MQRRKKTILALLGFILVVTFSLHFIPLKSKILAYCEPTKLVKTRYSFLAGEDFEYNQLNSGDTSGLLCSRGDIKVSLYLW